MGWAATAPRGADGLKFGLAIAGPVGDDSAMTGLQEKLSLFFVGTVMWALSVGAAEQVKPEDPLPVLPAGQQWKLVWSDEFDGAQLDESKWNRLGDSKRRDGFWVKEDAVLDGQGHLVLRVKKDGARFTSGAVNTRGKFEHAFGYYIARCKSPRQEGHWPAFWLMCDGVGKVGADGRDGTEIDIIEIPWRDGRLTSNLHWDGYGKQHQTAGIKFTVAGVQEGWHTYALWWKKDEYVFYVDGKETWRTTAGGVSQVPEFIKLTEEIGEWGGDIKKAALPDQFEVDYVRVYDVVP